MSGDKKDVVDEAAESKREAELQEKLNRVNDAYHQLTETRRTILRMLHPFHATVEHADPELVYSAFAHSAQKAVGDLKDFQTAMRDPKMQDLLKKSKDTIKEIETTNGGVEGWLGGLDGLQDDWQVNENTGAAVDGLDALKIEKETPKKT